MNAKAATAAKSSLAICLGVLSACGGSSDTPAPSPIAALTCDDTLKASFKPDEMTSVLLVKAYKKGDALLSPLVDRSQQAPGDLCLVKLLVGPGNPGPAGAPSTSAGIGMEIWLPPKPAWNGRLHLVGNGGFGGTAESDPTKVSSLAVSGDFRTAPTIAALEGSVVASTDMGHYSAGGAFAMKPDGTINTTLWNDFSARAIHEQVVKAKQLAAAYFGTAPKFTYWDGLSTGGRQGLKLAQQYPEDVDGIIAVNPAINWTKFITAELYPQIVIQRDLGGTAFTAAQLNLVSNNAIAACDLVGSTHLGFPLDPASCRYDPTKDTTVLCAASGGTNSTASCVSTAQARAINKIWYGMTADGSAPDPATDTGWAINPTGNQRWYGLERGASMAALVGTAPFSTGSDQVAVQLQNPTIATPSFLNATGNGKDGWKDLSYSQLSAAFDRGDALQPLFADINTDAVDLSKFKARGGKIIAMHGLADDRIFPQGSINYYERVSAAMGGFVSVQSFFRFYLIPGMGHVPGNGTTNPAANPPIPGSNQTYELLTAWVEKGVAPENVVLNSSSATPVQKSLPMCIYPKRVAYVNTGDVFKASSYECR